MRRADRPATRLTSQEAHLLARLARTPGVAVSRDDLLQEVWGFGTAVVSRAPDIAIRRLRTKVEVDPSHPRVITTVRGAGWRVEHAVVDSDNLTTKRAEQFIALALRHTPEALTDLVVAMDDALGNQLSSDERQHLLERALPTTAVLRRRAGVLWDRGLPGAREEVRRLRQRAFDDADEALADWLTIDLSSMNRADRAIDASERTHLDRITASPNVDLRVAALLELATVDADLGNWDDAGRWLQAARPYATQGDRRIEWACAAGHLALTSSRAAEGLAAVEPVLAQLSSDRLAERTWRTLGGLRFFDDDLSGARDAWESALFLARRLGCWRQVASTVGNLGIVQAELGDLDAAHSAFEEALGRSQELGQHQTTASNQVNIGLVTLLQGHVDAARTAFESGHQAATAQARRPTARLAELGLGIANQLTGQPATPALLQLADEAQEAGDLRIAGLALAHASLEDPDHRLRLDCAPFADQPIAGVRAVWDTPSQPPASVSANARLWLAAYKAVTAG